MSESDSGGKGGHSEARGSPMERQRVIDALCDHYARDHLEMAEFERRIDRAHRAHSLRELRQTLAGLPSLAEGGGTSLASSGAGSGSALDAGVESGGLPAVDGEPRPWVALPPGVPVPERQTEVAIFSGRTRKGGWVPARRILGLALMGGIELDFREAQLSAGVTRVTVLACMGGVDVIVPPGVRVETDGFALLGGFDEDVDALEPVDPRAPVIRISGFSVLGGLDVTCRRAGESARQAKRRRKELRRQNREERARRLERGGG